MTDVTSLEVSKELYEVSGWDDQTWWHCYEWDDNDYKTGEKSVETTSYIWYTSNEDKKISPAYDLGYLLRKLPRTHGGVGLCVWAAGRTLWIAEYNGTLTLQATTPEDAAAKLAIELFKQGILKKGV